MGKIQTITTKVCPTSLSLEHLSASHQLTMHQIPDTALT